MVRLTLLLIYSFLVWQSTSAKAILGYGHSINRCERKCPVYIVAPKPVCDKRGRQYLDTCRAKCAGERKVGPCKEEPKPCVCTREYNPVCSKGITYSNKCVARCNGAKNFQPGQCKKNCVCPLIFAPVCYKKKTYSNECEARCAGAKKKAIKRGKCRETHDGGDNGNCKIKTAACLSTIRCSSIDNPVCVDGKTYRNACQASCLCPKPRHIRRGKCRGHRSDGGGFDDYKHKPCVCPKIYRPVCYKEKTYSNSCEARCNGARKKHIKQGECCLGCAVKCTKNYKPVCADGKTYRNRCQTFCLCPKPKRIVPGKCKVHSGHGHSGQVGHGYNGHHHSQKCFGVVFKRPRVKNVRRSSNGRKHIFRRQGRRHFSWHRYHPRKIHPRNYWRRNRAHRVRRWKRFT